MIGDWIEVPKYGADGIVTELTMTTVKVQNFDKTIVNIPAYALISDSFKNWRGMSEAGGRRIKRSVNIDINTVRFCTTEMIEKYKRIGLLREYIEKKEADIARYNTEHNVDTSLIINGRRLTNLGTFRAYIENYLNTNPNIHRSLTRMVRQLMPTEHGVALEIYAFTTTTKWIEYEAIQADIFDHIIAAAPEFDLRIYQQPSGNDLRSLSTPGRM
jgi:miniconductance mechanosensitive channel